MSGDIQKIIRAAVEQAVKDALAADRAARGEVPAPKHEAPSPTFAELWEQYKEWGLMHIPSWKRSQGCHEPHILKFFGTLRWNEVTPAKDWEYRQARAKMKGEKSKKLIMASTRNLEMRSVKGCLKFAEKRGLIVGYPLKGAEDEPEEDTRDFDVQPDQFLRIWRCARPTLQLMMPVWLGQGFRNDEGRSLKWSEVDIKNRMIILPKERTKNKKGGVFPITDLAYRCIVAAKAAYAHMGSEYVFPNQLGRPGPVPRTTLWGWFDEARRKAGVSGPRGQNVWIHSLRKSWASWNAMGGTPTAMVMDIGRWADKKTMDLYVHMGPEWRANALAHMNRAMTKVTGEIGSLIGADEEDERPSPERDRRPAASVSHFPAQRRRQTAE